MSIKSGSTAIKALCLGTNELQKIYLGANLVYQKSGGGGIEFSSCPFPTQWTKISDTNYTSTNDYGLWNITSDSYRSTGYLVHRAFDGDNGTAFELMRNVPRWAEISMPDNILIKPKEILIRHSYNAATDVIQGYNPNTNEWENIGTLPTQGVSPVNTTLVYSGNTYFSKFRLYSTKRRSNSGDGRYLNLWEFQITSGIIRTKN